MELLKTGRFPEEVHFDVKQYAINEICDESDKNKSVDASKWLLNLWKEKEERLKAFYEIDRKFKPSGSGYVWPVSTFSIAYFAAFLFWTISSTFWLYLIYTSLYIKLYVLVALAFFIWSLKAKGGLELVILDWFYGKRLYLAPK